MEASDKWHQDHYVKPRGVRWYDIPAGMTAAEYMAMNDPEKHAAKRRTPLEDAFDSNGALVFYSLHESEGES